MQRVRFTCLVTCWLCSSVRHYLQSGQVNWAAGSLHSGSQRSWSRHTEAQTECRGTRHQDRSKPPAGRWAHSQGERSLSSERRDNTMRMRVTPCCLVKRQNRYICDILSAHHGPCSAPALGWRKPEKALQASFLQLESEEELETLEKDKKLLQSLKIYENLHLCRHSGLLLKWYTTAL